MKENKIIIRSIATLEEINQVPQVESAIWGKGLSSAIPTHLLIAIAKNDGLLLGAYIDRKLIGFMLGWLGTTDSDNPQEASQHLKLVSHMNGVLPEYRDQRIGLRLKLAQREWALARKLALVTWTFDPLESRNARLNIQRLGATCQIYLRDVYGELADGLNSGIATDRFRVDWYINGKHVRDKLVSKTKASTLADLNAQLLNSAILHPDRHPHPAERIEKPAKKQILVEIPANIQVIRQDDLALGIAWREHTRGIFESLFAEGYKVTDFIYEQDSSFARSFYLLENRGISDEN